MIYILDTDANTKLYLKYLYQNILPIIEIKSSWVKPIRYNLLHTNSEYTIFPLIGHNSRLPVLPCAIGFIIGN